MAAPKLPSVSVIFAYLTPSPRLASIWEKCCNVAVPLHLKSMYNSPIEAELNALNKCGALLTELDANAKIGVLKYLVEMFDLAKLLQPLATNEPSFKEQASTNSAPKLIDNQERFKTTSKSELGDDVEAEEVNADFPTIKDIVMRDLPKVETEWVLIYAFYASGFGKETFTKESISQGYTDSGRHDKQRIKNLSGNFRSCIVKTWFKGINNTTYMVTPEGKRCVDLILAGKSEGKPKPQNKKKPVKANKE